MNVLNIVELKKKMTKGQLRVYIYQRNYLVAAGGKAESSIRLAYKRAMKVA